MNTNLYILSTADDLEYVVGVAESLYALSRLTGIGFDALYKGYKRKTKVAHQYKVEKVSSEELEEKFDFDTYKKFCTRYNLKPSNVRSLEKFNNYFYGG